MDLRLWIRVGLKQNNQVRDMYIKKLDIRGFGKLSDLTLELSRGLNIIYGANESGKSSIQAFIKGMLFGLRGGRAGKDGTIPPLKKYKPWSGKDYNGSMEYGLDNGDIFRVGRNFNSSSTKVFDYLFNDITGTFEVSKDKGVQFADKHLGVNEACFEKTVFIKQMESRVSEDGSKELINKLSNFIGTGSEDISFIKAGDALREALKTYVGTDKTSTRPLDKVNTNLDRLRAERDLLLKKRNHMFKVEDDLKTVIDLKKEFEDKRALLDRASEIISLKEKIGKWVKNRKGLDEAIKELETLEGELGKVSEKMEEFNAAREAYATFSQFDNGDIDTLTAEYQRLLTLIDEGKRLKNQVEKRKEEGKKAENRFDALRPFGKLENSIEDTVLILKKELDYLTSEYEKNNIELLNERIKSAQGKVKRISYNIVASCIFTLVLLLTGILKFNIGLYVAPAALAVTGIMVFLRRNAAQKLKDMVNEKKIVFISISSVTSEIEQKRKKLEQIFGSVGADGIESFLRLKADYDNKVLELAEINSDIIRLEGELEVNLHSINSYRNVILEKLMRAGVIDSYTEQITEDNISSFKYGVRRYLGLLPSISYTEQRLQDLRNDTQILFGKASFISGIPYKDITELKQAAADVYKTTSQLEAKLDEVLSEYEMNICKYTSLPEGIINLRNEIVSSDLKSIGSLVTEYSMKLGDELNEAGLKIKEYETLLKSFDDTEEIQKLDEEIEELLTIKNRLSDMEFSLKTALEVLTEASAEIQRDFAPVLNSNLSSIINRISGGRYRELRADDNLQLKTIAPETGEIVNAVILSGGTTDQMYLALRLAMGDIIAPSGEKLPLIMDEILAQYDDFRTRETLKFLCELAIERQIIFFTCKKREVEIASEICTEGFNIIELDKTVL